jgi:phosphopantothenoylcysteine decarboxylase/phosphopantothenate--cysteine ligase
VRFAVGVSGGIAAYKACEVVRGLTTAGAEVQVLMTQNAARFITPLTLQTLSGRKVWTDPWDLEDDEVIRHIDLARGIDAYVVAPATANVLAKLAYGIADDLVSTLYLAVTGPVVLAPAMNTRMWEHAATREAVARLAARGHVIVPPESGWLAERESGVGRLADPARIVRTALDAAARSTALSGKKILVTAGTHPGGDRPGPVPVQRLVREDGVRDRRGRGPPRSFGRPRHGPRGPSRSGVRARRPGDDRP